MQDIIQLLPDSVANQIAAGEVVQRPASIVKELLENAIDAKATKIHLIIKDAGKTLVQVIDDGIGMSETDARLSFERHATSKIRKADDLFNLYTMGFRGEALASIAAVAQVEMKTRREVDELGTWLQIEGSHLQKQSPTPCPVGTSIVVKNLFFNIPARKNFLKSNALEMKHIIEEFTKVALAYPTIAFHLTHQDAEIFHLLTGKLHQRIVQLFGNNYKPQLVACQETTPWISLQGYIGKPEFAKKTRGEQYFFVNNRYIRHAYLHNAIQRAYENLIPANHHPFYVLFLSIEPKHIDINIHPTKTEIKFDDERTIYAIVQAAVRNALAVHHLTPSIDFETDANFSLTLPQHQTPAISPATPQQERTWKPEPYNTRQQNNLQNWNKLYEYMQNNAEETTEKQVQITLESKVNQIHQVENLTIDVSPETPCLHLPPHWLLLSTKQGILLLNQVRMYERLYFDKLYWQSQKTQSDSQKILFPISLTLNTADFSLLNDLAPHLRKVGFTFDLHPPQKIVLTGLPTGSQEDNEQQFLEEIIEHYKNTENPTESFRTTELIQILAKRYAQKATKKVAPTEAKTMITQLLQSQNPNYSQEGKPIFKLLSPEMLNQLLP